MVRGGPCSQRRPYHRKSDFETEGIQSGREWPRNRLCGVRRKCIRHKPRERGQIRPARRKIRVDIKYLIRGGGGVRLSSVRQRSSPFRISSIFQRCYPLHDPQSFAIIRHEPRHLLGQMLGQDSLADNIMAGRRLSKRLTARTVETLTTPGRHADGDGLYLTVRAGGSKQWIFLYRSGGRLREMGLGSPASGVTLAKARQLAAEARGQKSNGRDPLEARRQAEEQAAQIPKFGDYALALVDRIEVGFSNAKHRQQWRNTLTTYCQPIWTQRIDQVDTKGVLDCLTPIWTSKPETASRLRGRIERVLNAAKAERLRVRREPGCLARSPRCDLATTQQSLARTSRGASLSRAARLHGRTSQAGGNRRASSRVRDPDRDPDKRSAQCNLGRIRSRSGGLDDSRGENEGARRASRAALAPGHGDSARA